MVKAKQIFNLSLFLIIFRFEESLAKNLRPGGDPMVIVGLYHQCPGEENVTQSNICQAAVDYVYQYKKLSWKNYLKEKDFDQVGDLLTMDDVEYQVFNFCSITKAIQIAMSLKVNDSYFVSKKEQHIPQWNKRNVKFWQYTSRIILVIIHAPNEISKLLQEIFFGEDFVVRFVNTDVRIQVSLQQRNLHSDANIFDVNARNFLYYFNNQANRNIDPESFAGYGNKNYNQYKDFIVIYLESNLTFYKLDYEHFYNIVQEYTPELGLCPKFYTIRLSNSENDTKTLFKAI